MKHVRRKCRSCGTDQEFAYRGECDTCYVDSWYFFCKQHGTAVVDESGCNSCGYEFEGTIYKSPELLAAALASKWDAAVKHVRKESLYGWCSASLSDRGLIKALRQLENDRDLRHEERLATGLIVLDRNRSLVWRGEEITPSAIYNCSQAVFDLLGSNVPHRVNRVKGVKWLANASKRFRARVDRLRSFGISAQPQHMALLAAREDEVQADLCGFRQHFFSARDPELNKLMLLDALDDANAVVILLSERTRFLSRVDAWETEGRNHAADLQALRVEICRTPTNLLALDRCSEELLRRNFDYRNARAGLLLPGVELALNESVVRLEEECESLLSSRLGEHSRQKSLKSELDRLSRIGRLQEAKRLSRGLSVEFTDLDLGFVRAACRRLRFLTGSAWSVGVLSVSVVLAALGWRWRDAQMATRILEPFEVALGGKQKVHFVPVRSGQFFMGARTDDKDADPDERPQKRVTIPRPFWISETEITISQWLAVMGLFRSKDLSVIASKKANVGQLPVTGVSWKDATHFCGMLKREYGSGYGDIRLPTEAEWEYTCRAGVRTRFSFGDHTNKIPANVGGISALPVKSFPPNGWGMYDMHGNVAEWVSGGVEEDVENAHSMRLYRGGSWKLPASMARASQRNWRENGRADDHIGFRVVCIP